LSCRIAISRSIGQSNSATRNGDRFFKANSSFVATQLYSTPGGRTPFGTRTFSKSVGALSQQFDKDDDADDINEGYVDFFDEEEPEEDDFDLNKFRQVPLDPATAEALKTRRFQQALYHYRRLYDKKLVDQAKERMGDRIDQAMHIDNESRVDKQRAFVRERAKRMDGWKGVFSPEPPKVGMYTQNNLENIQHELKSFVSQAASGEFTDFDEMTHQAGDFWSKLPAHVQNYNNIEPFVQPFQLDAEQMINHQAKLSPDKFYRLGDEEINRHLVAFGKHRSVVDALRSALYHLRRIGVRDIRLPERMVSTPTAYRYGALKSTMIQPAEKVPELADRPYFTRNTAVSRQTGRLHQNLTELPEMGADLADWTWRLSKGVQPHASLLEQHNTGAVDTYEVTGNIEAYTKQIMEKPQSLSTFFETNPMVVNHNQEVIDAIQAHIDADQFESDEAREHAKLLLDCHKINRFDVDALEAFMDQQADNPAFNDDFQKQWQQQIDTVKAINAFQDFSDQYFNENENLQNIEEAKLGEPVFRFVRKEALFHREMNRFLTKLNDQVSNSLSALGAEPLEGHMSSEIPSGMFLEPTETNEQYMSDYLDIRPHPSTEQVELKQYGKEALKEFNDYLEAPLDFPELQDLSFVKGNESKEFLRGLYQVQLTGDPPSHLDAYVYHCNRGGLFKQTEFTDVMAQMNVYEPMRNRYKDLWKEGLRAIDRFRYMPKMSANSVLGAIGLSKQDPAAIKQAAEAEAESNFQWQCETGLFDTLVKRVERGSFYESWKIYKGEMSAASGISTSVTKDTFDLRLPDDPEELYEFLSKPTFGDERMLQREEKKFLAYMEQVYKDRAARLHNDVRQEDVAHILNTTTRDKFERTKPLYRSEESLQHNYNRMLVWSVVSMDYLRQAYAECEHAHDRKLVMCLLVMHLHFEDVFAALVKGAIDNPDAHKSGEMQERIAYHLIVYSEWLEHQKSVILEMAQLGLPLLWEKPQKVPTPRRAVRISTTKIYDAKGTPATDQRSKFESRKSKVLLDVPSLKLPAVVEANLIAIAGPRYHQKKRLITITADKYPDANTNRNHALQMAKRLIHEAFLSSPQFVPVQKDNLEFIDFGDPDIINPEKEYTTLPDEYFDNTHAIHLDPQFAADKDIDQRKRKKQIQQEYVTFRVSLPPQQDLSR